RTAEIEAHQDWSALAESAAGWADRFPLDERPQLRRIDALSKCGRVAEAAATRDAFVRRLRAETDDEPSPEWIATTDRVLREGRSAEARSELDRVVEVPRTTSGRMVQRPNA